MLKMRFTSKMLRNSLHLRCSEGSFYAEVTEASNSIAYLTLVNNI